MRNKHSMGRRFLALLLCALMMVGLMPATALAATKTVNSASELQNAINNAGNGDTIKLGANITFDNSSQIKKVADFYQNWEVLTYKVRRAHFAERCPSLASIPIGPWKNLYDSIWQYSDDFNLPVELRPDDSRRLRVTKDGKVYDGDTETRVREHGDATTYLLVKDKNLTIDLNGYTISASHDDPYFSALLVTGKSTVTINGSGGITSSGTAVTVSGTNAKVTINGGNFKGGTTAVSVRDYAEAHLNGGSFTGANMTEKKFESEYFLENESKWEQEDSLGDKFGYETIHTITRYTGTAIRTVPCGTLYNDRGKIFIGENKSSTPRFNVPEDGSLFSAAGLLYTVKIYGGIFDTAPKESYIAENYYTLQNDNGTYEVVSIEDPRIVAMVQGRGVGTTSEYAYGIVYCTSLDKAVDLAKENSIVTLMQDISGEQYLMNFNTYRLDLNGHTINGNVIINGGNVTLRNGTISYDGPEAALNATAFLQNLTLDCNVNATPDGKALLAMSGTINVTGGTYTGKLEESGGTLAIKGGRYKSDPSAYLVEGFYTVMDPERYYVVTDSPFVEIWNKDDLLSFAQRVNGGDTEANAILMADIDLSGVTWTPIKEFSGSFNGNKYSITNFNSTQGGLFDAIKSGGIVSNVTISSGSISGSSWIGAIANENSGSIRGCINRANVTGGTRVGGIAGSGGTIEECGNYGTIKGEEFVGGIVGTNAIINNCYNVGSVEATNAKHTVSPDRWDYYTGAGGIVSPADGNLYSSKANNCFNYGTISANNNYFVPVSLKGNNNWHLDTTAKGSAVPEYTSSQEKSDAFKSGKITWLLNGNKADGAWYQTLGADQYPVLDSTHAKVYKVGDGYTNYTFKSIGTINPVNVPGGNTVAGIIDDLPRTVPVISNETDVGLTAEATWDTSPLSSYNPNNWEAQTFTLKGTAHVTGLLNSSEQDVEVTVTVDDVTPTLIEVKEVPTKLKYIDGDALDLSGAKFTVTYNDVNETALVLDYDSQGIKYIIGRDTEITHGTLLGPEYHGGYDTLSLKVRYENCLSNFVDLKFLSKDNSIKLIRCGPLDAQYDGNNSYTLIVPSSWDYIPKPEGYESKTELPIYIDLTDDGASKNVKPVEGRNDYWEITVTAENGDEAIYFLQVNKEGWNEDIINKLKTAWNGIEKTWKPTQAEVQQGTSVEGDENNLSYEDQLKSWLIQNMVEGGMEIPANVTTDISFTPETTWATAGNKTNYDGTDGSFEFSITFTANQGSESNHKKVTFDSQSGIITATPYVRPNYMVHFDSNGGSAVDDITVPEDAVIGTKAPADPTFEHYTFLGWFTEQTGGEKWDMATGEVVNNMTLYAHWELTKYKVVLPENQHGYTLTTDKEEAGWNENITFTYKLGVGYNGDALVIKVNGSPVTPDENGQFTVGGNVDSDIVVTVDGVINAPTYSVTIPESVDLDSTLTVSTAGVNVAEGSSLYVAIGGEFTIANSNPLFKQTIGYPVHLDSKSGTQVQPDDTVLTVAGGIANNTGSQVLYFGLPTEEPKYADDYKGTVTFRIGIQDTE